MITPTALESSTALSNSLAAAPLSIGSILLSVLAVILVLGAIALAAVWMIWGRRD